MAKSKAAKLEMAQEFGKLFEGASALMVAEYRGIAAEDLSSLRRSLRPVGSSFKVVKNRVAIKALESKVPELKDLSNLLTGPVGIICVESDVAQSAKQVLEFAKDHEEFVITGGVVAGKPVSVEDIKALSKLPSKEVLLGQIVGLLVSPHRGLMTVLNGVGTNVVRVINAIKDQKS